MTERTHAERIQDGLVYGFTYGGIFAVGGKFLLEALNGMLGGVLMDPMVGAKLLFGVGMLTGILMSIEKRRREKTAGK